MAQTESVLPWLAGVWVLMLVARTVGEFLRGRRATATAVAVLAAWTVALEVRLVTMTGAPVGARSLMMLYWLLGAGVWLVALLAVGEKRSASKAS